MYHWFWQDLCILARSLYVYENTEFSLQSFLSKQFALVQCYIHFVIGNRFLHIFLEPYIYIYIISQQFTQTFRVPRNMKSTQDPVADLEGACPPLPRTKISLISYGFSENITKILGRRPLGIDAPS